MQTMSSVLLTAVFYTKTQTKATLASSWPYTRDFIVLRITPTNETFNSLSFSHIQLLWWGSSFQYNWGTSRARKTRFSQLLKWPHRFLWTWRRAQVQLKSTKKDTQHLIWGQRAGIGTFLHVLRRSRKIMVMNMNVKVQSPSSGKDNHTVFYE